MIRLDSTTVDRLAIAGLVAGIAAAASFAVPAKATETCVATIENPPAEAPKPKKKGPGFGGLLSAAKRASVDRMLGTGQLLGHGTTAQVAGAVAGTAVAASDGSGVDVTRGAVGMMGSNRAAQIAGAVTGTAVNAAAAAAPCHGAE